MVLVSSLFCQLFTKSKMIRNFKFGMLKKTEFFLFVLLTVFTPVVRADDGIEVFVPLFVVIIFIAVCCSICKKCCQESIRKQIVQSQNPIEEQPTQPIYPTQPTYGYSYMTPTQPQPYIHPPPLPPSAPPPYYQVPSQPPQPGFSPVYNDLPSAPPPPYSEK